MNQMRRNQIFFLAVIIMMVVTNLLNGRYSNPGAWLMEELLMLPGIVIGLSFHEFGHAAASVLLGDPTPKQQGRLTLNPAAHMDIFGFVCLLFAGFGWGVPVEIDPRNYKHPRRDELIVSLAGVVMNFLTAVVFALLMRLMIRGGLVLDEASQAADLPTILYDILRYVVQINVVLMVFNLLPCPPLDGFGILTQIFNLRKYRWYYPLYSNGGVILILLIFLRGVDLVLDPGIRIVWSWLMNTIVLG